MPEPIPLTARITIALNEVRAARTEGDASREWSWTSILDRLTDRHIILLKAASKFVPLEVCDAALSQHLTVHSRVRLVGRILREGRAPTPMG